MAPKHPTGNTSDYEDGDDDAEYSDNEPSGSYRLENALKVPRATTYTAQALYDQILSGDVNLDPEYQRDVVWAKDKQTRLIDSVLRNFYIPPVIFAVNIHSDGSETKTCIDGKQRLTSIHRFMDGLIPHIDPYTNKKYYYKNTTSSSRQLLPAQYKRIFANKQVVCVEYSDLSPENERDIFKRVQMGMALTPAEKLGANDTPRSNWIKELCGGQVVPNLPFAKNRGSNFRVVASMLYNVANWPDVKDASAKVDKWVEARDPIPTSFRKAVEDTLDLMARINFHLEGGKNKRVSPIEMIGQAILMYVRRKAGVSESEMQRDSEALHNEMKAAFTDLRMNTRCGTWMISWVKERAAQPVSLKRQRDEDEYNPQKLPSPKLTSPKR